MSQKFKRRNYFIKKNFQGRMVLSFFLFVIGSIILFTVILGFFSADSMTMSYRNNSLQLGQTPIMLFKDALAANWIFIIFGGSLLVIAALLVSHRIAGPQFRFEKTLKAMIDGNLDDTIYLRTHDEGSELADLINSFNVQLSAKIREMEKNTLLIEEQLALLEMEELLPEAAESAREKMTTIRRHNNATRQVAASFTLTDE